MQFGPLSALTLGASVSGLTQGFVLLSYHVAKEGSGGGGDIFFTILQIDSSLGLQLTQRPSRALWPSAY